MSGENPDLLATAAALDAARTALEQAKEATDDTACFIALNDQLTALQQRVAKVDGLIFADRSQAISDAAAGVEAAQGQLADALKDIQNLNRTIGTVTAFLGLVDKVIAAAGAVGIG
jgi:adenine/guanine phosphoribosyltransferase-like PRPP-binding protein